MSADQTEYLALFSFTLANRLQNRRLARSRHIISYAYVTCMYTALYGVEITLRIN